MKVIRLAHKVLNTGMGDRTLPFEPQMIDHGSAFKPVQLGLGNDGIGRLLPHLGIGLGLFVLSLLWPITIAASGGL